jgi:hypothetical protein
VRIELSHNEKISVTFKGLAGEVTIEAVAHAFYLNVDAPDSVGWLLTEEKKEEANGQDTLSS